MLNNLTGWHFLIILVIVLLLFGAPKLPGLARSLGQSMKIFKSEIKDVTEESAIGSAAATRVTPDNARSTRITDHQPEKVDAADPATHR